MAGSAAAATATYPDGGSGFGAGVEGWSSSDTACTPIELLCSTDAEHDTTTGNPAGSIVVETTATLNLLSLFKGNATWNSPEFTVPVGAITAANLRLDRSYSTGALVNVEPTASYVVTLTDLTNGISTVALSETVDDAGSYAGASAPVAVVGGHRYRLTIASEIGQSTLALSLLSGTTSLGFDNIGVVVQTGGGGGGGDGKGSDGSGGAGGGGSDIRRNRSDSALSDRRLLSLLGQGSTSGPATLKGERLFVKVGCPAKVGRTCRITAQGMLNRRKPATGKRTVKVAKGKSRQVVLRVKPKQLAKVKKRKRLLVREKVRAGSATATIQKSRKLIRR